MERASLRAFGSASALIHEVLAGSDHAMSRDVWRRAWSATLVRWLAARRAE